MRYTVITTVSLSSSSLGWLLASIAFIAAAYYLYIRPTLLSNIANLAGPPSSHWVLGNTTDLFARDAVQRQLAWARQYGRVFRLNGPLGSRGVVFVSSDQRALNHILLQRSYQYPKPLASRKGIASLLGEGLVVSEGSDHKRQRRVLQPAFTAAQINATLPSIQSVTARLIDRIDDEVKAARFNTPGDSDTTIVDFVDHLSNTSMDIIGLVGFDYDLEQTTLSSKRCELAAAFKAIAVPGDFSPGRIIGQLLVSLVPDIAKYVSSTARAVKRSADIMQAEGQKMVNIRQEQCQSGDLGEKKDLLSLVFKANLKVSNPSEKLSETCIRGQISTFLVAGFDTSATSMMWTLVHLAQDQQMQARIRAEIQTALQRKDQSELNDLTAEDLQTLPYLNAVIREVLRFYPPVPVTAREAGQDDFIPLSNPVRAKDGREISSIPVRKGQAIMLGLHAFNVSSDIFGEDASEFRPERWLEKDLAHEVQGFAAWSSLMTFLGGPRGCIGLRVAILEMHYIVASLVTTFEILPRDGQVCIRPKSGLEVKPVVQGEEGRGFQVPLRVRRMAA